jgi:hypothetical protein
MAKHDEQRTMWARRAVGATLAAAGLLMAAPVGIAFADDPHTPGVPPGVGGGGDGGSPSMQGGIDQRIGGSPSQFKIYAGPDDPQPVPIGGGGGSGCDRGGGCTSYDWTPGQIVKHFTPGALHPSTGNAGGAGGAGGAP